MKISKIRTKHLEISSFYMSVPKIMIIWYIAPGDMASDRCNYLKNEWRNNIYKTFQNSSKNLAEYNTLQQAISEVSDLIYEKKNDYYNAVAKKLSDPETSSKT